MSYPRITSFTETPRSGSLDRSSCIRGQASFLSPSPVTRAALDAPTVPRRVPSCAPRKARTHVLHGELNDPRNIDDTGSWVDRDHEPRIAAGGARKPDRTPAGRVRARTLAPAKQLGPVGSALRGSRLRRADAGLA